VLFPEKVLGKGEREGLRGPRNKEEHAKGGQFLIKRGKPATEEGSPHSQFATNQQKRTPGGPKTCPGGGVFHRAEKISKTVNPIVPT